MGPKSLPSETPTRRQPARRAAQAAPPLALTMQQNTTASTQSDTSASSTALAPIVLPQPHNRAMAARVEVLSSLALQFGDEYLTPDKIKERLLGQDKSFAGHNDMDMTVRWFTNLTSQISQLGDAVEGLAYQISLIQDNDIFKTSQKLVQQTTDAFGSIKKLASNGRSAASRVQRLADNGRMFFGHAWFNAYFEPVFTAGMGDEFNRHYAHAIVYGISPLALTGFIYSAWGKRIQTAVSQSDRQGIGSRGVRPDPKLQNVDVKNGCLAIYSDEPGEFRLPSNARPTSALVARLNAFLSGTLNYKGAIVVLDRYGFPHVHRILEPKLAINSTTPFLPTPSREGKLASSYGKEKKPPIPPQRAKVPQGDFDSKFVFEDQSKKKPGSLSSLPGPGQGTKSGAKVPATPRTVLSQGVGKLSISDTPKRTASAMSSISDGRYQPTNSRQINVIDLDTYQYSGTGPLRYADFQPQLTKMEHRIEENLNKAPWNVSSPPSSRSGSPRSFNDADRFARRFMKWIAPPNASEIDKKMAAYLYQLGQDSTYGSTQGKSYGAQIFTGYSPQDIRESLVRVGKHTLESAEKLPGTSTWPEDWKAHYYHVLNHFYAIDMASLCSRPPWIQTIGEACARIMSLAAETNNQYTPVVIGRDHQGEFTMRASQMAMDALVVAPGMERGWLSLDTLLLAMRSLVTIGVREQPTQIVLSGETIVNWEKDKANKAANRHPVFPQMNAQNEKLPVSQQSQAYTKRPEIPVGALHIYLPFHINNNHFVLVIVDLDPAEPTVHFCDSLKGDGTSVMNTVLHWICEVCPWLPRSIWTETPHNVPRQTNSADCGFWVWYHMKMFKKFGAPQFSQVPTSELRIQFTNELAGAYKLGWDVSVPPPRAEPARSPSASPSPHNRSPSPGPTAPTTPVGRHTRQRSLSRVDQLKQEEGTPRSRTKMDIIEEDHTATSRRRSQSPMDIDHILSDFSPGFSSDPFIDTKSSRNASPKPSSRQGTPAKSSPPPPSPSPPVKEGQPIKMDGSWYHEVNDPKAGKTLRRMGDRQAKKWFTENNMRFPE